ncbi:conserved hypothetical protein [Ricinus communis]|uniref:Uncharacterized protein n=1 Tax=Ricinus communis TaxID=3988 RepID=B9RIH9_RICCO|nr:conserved hypothetical protein [Ricinus communis]
MSNQLNQTTTPHDRAPPQQPPLPHHPKYSHFSSSDDASLPCMHYELSGQILVHPGVAETNNGKNYEPNYYIYTTLSTEQIGKI